MSNRSKLSDCKRGLSTATPADYYRWWRERAALRLAIEELEAANMRLSDRGALGAKNEALKLRIAELEARDRIMVDALAEIKATNDGDSAQPIAKILDGCINELGALNKEQDDE